MKKKILVRTMAIGLSAAMALAQPIAVFADTDPGNEDPDGKGDKEPEEALEDVVGESEAVDTSINTIADDVDKLNDAKLSDAYQEVNNNIYTSEENLAKQSATEDIKSAVSNYTDSVNADKKLTEAREAGLEGLKASEQSISEAETLIEAKNQQIEDISATITTATTIEEATQNYNKAVEVQKEVQQIYDNAANEALAAQNKYDEAVSKVNEAQQELDKAIAATGTDLQSASKKLAEAKAEAEKLEEYANAAKAIAEEAKKAAENAKNTAEEAYNEASDKVDSQNTIVEQKEKVLGDAQETAKTAAKTKSDAEVESNSANEAYDSAVTAQKDAESKLKEAQKAAEVADEAYGKLAGQKEAINLYNKDESGKHKADRIIKYLYAYTNYNTDNKVIQDVDTSKFDNTSDGKVFDVKVTFTDGTTKVLYVKGENKKYSVSETKDFSNTIFYDSAINDAGLAAQIEEVTKAKEAAETELTSAQQNKDAADKALAAATERKNTAQDAVTTAGNALSEANKAVEKALGELTTEQGKLATLEELLTTAETNLNTAKTNLENAGKEQEKANDLFGQLGKNATDAQDAVEKAQADVDILSEALKALQNSGVEAKTRAEVAISALKLAWDNANSKLSDAESSKKDADEAAVQAKKNYDDTVADINSRNKNNNNNNADDDDGDDGDGGAGTNGTGATGGINNNAGRIQNVNSMSASVNTAATNTIVRGNAAADENLQGEGALAVDEADGGALIENVANNNISNNTTAPDTVKIEDNATPLADVAPLTEEEKANMPWWWIPIVAALGTVGIMLYRKYRKEGKKQSL